MNSFQNRPASFGIPGALLPGRLLSSVPVRLVLVMALVAAIASFLLFTGAVPTGASHLTGTTATYTLTGDFDEGTKVNVVTDDDEVKLDDTTTPFGFVWIAESSKGAVLRVDTDTGDIIGEYRSGPDGVGRDPSRTTVDLNGNAWVANRQASTFFNEGAIDPVGVPTGGPAGPIQPVPFAGRNMGSVVHIGLIIGGTRVNADGTTNPVGDYLAPPFIINNCQDRDGDGLIYTSRGFGDIRPWPNAGGVDTPGGVSTATDECILHHTRTNATGTRHISVDANNDVWVSGIGGRHFDLIDGSTGLIKRQEPTINVGGYGGLIDGNGVIWSATTGSTGMLRWDTSTALVGNGQNINIPSYGLCIDSTGHVWTTGLSGSQIRKLDPAGNVVLGPVPHGNANAQGCAVDQNDDVWVAHSLFNANTLGHLDNAGNHLGNVQLDPGNVGPTGVAVDANNKVWTTGNNDGRFYRVDPSLAGGVGETDFASAPTGGSLYNYSDMTGSTLSGAPGNGTWTIVHDTGVPGAQWGSVSWNASTPDDSSISVTVASSNDGVTFGPSEAATNGGDLTVADGQFLRVVVSLTRATTGATPILFDLTIRAVDPEVEVAVDIRPTSCPNPLNVRQRGVLPVAVLGTADFDVTEIDASTVQLQGVSALRSSLEDVATPFDGPFSDPPDAMDCTTEGADGFTDLVLHFDAQSVSGTLGNPADGTVMLLTLTGQLNDGTPIVGADVVRIINRSN